MAADVSTATGLIYDVERFAITDGPGIRTLVFLKGCPLHCLWCSSPHTKLGMPELLYDEGRCSTSGRCLEVCPQKAISLRGSGGIEIDRELCDGCGDCVEVCPSGALELAGRSMTPEELVEELTRDSAFFRRSGGGVTIGGGEPTAQAEFVFDVLGLCKRRYLHTAMETCGHVEWERLERLLDHLDLMFVDLKHMDDKRHRDFTGVSNELILDNVKRSVVRCSVILRIPVVPGFNDTDENIRATAGFAASLGDGFQHVELLPYHLLGIDVYRKLGREYQLGEVEPPSDEHMESLKEIAEESGIEVRIGG